MAVVRPSTSEKRTSANATDPPQKLIAIASIKRRSDGRWRARYRDDQDREHSRHFARKIDDETWLAE